MNTESRQTPIIAASPLDHVKNSIQSDLQYVSIQIENKSYGGWYRFLPDGRIELMALAHLHSAIPADGAPVDQARNMLSEFVRARLKPNSNGANESDNGLSRAEEEVESAVRQQTLGDVLYADRTKARVAEEDWVRLVQGIAARDQPTLYQLFIRMQRVVFTLLMRMTNDRETADELTLDVFQKVWRHASEYDPAAGSVIGWIMNQARAVAVERLRFKAARADLDRAGALKNDVAILTPEERQIIESLFFAELNCDELARERHESPANIKRRAHAGLDKLRRALNEGVAD